MVGTKKKWNKKKILVRTLMVLSFSIASLFAIVSFYIYINLRTLPTVNTQSMNSYDVTKIYDKNNNVIWQPTDKHVGIMNVKEAPDLYTKALVNVEDEDYWSSKGYSMKGIANMLFSVIVSKVNPNVVARGGSTLEQQLIKNVYFDGGQNVKTTTRKIQEIYLAQQLNHNFNKDEILRFYVNNLEFAEGDKGVKAVMMTYFGKSPSDYKENTVANISEQAYMAGLGQNPTIYNAYTNSKAANERKNTVLSVMLEKGLINNRQYKEAKDYDIVKSLKPRHWEADAQRAQNLKYKTYTDQVLNNVINMGYNPSNVSLGIHTYLDPQTFGKITNTIRENKYYQDGDNTENAEQVGGTVLSQDGIVIGMVGSRFGNDENNRAIQRTRSSGSSLKPFTAYGPLLQYFGNQYNTASQFSSGDYQYPGTNTLMHNWGDYTYGNVPIQYALRMSLNTVVARIDDEVLGSNRMKTFLHGVGLDTKPTYSSIDGIGLYVSSLDAAAAWNSLNNGGIYIKPRFVDSITFSDGTTKKIEPEKKRVMNASTAYVLTQMLRGTVRQGFSASSGAIPSYDGYAGKTGTVGLDSASQSPNVYGDGGSDSWYNSITNNGYAISLWFGYDKPNSSPQVADIFDGPQYLGRDLQLMLNNKPTLPNWDKPDNVRVLGGSGLDTNYAITDSSDITGNTSVSIAKISDNYNRLSDISKAKPETKSNNDWINSLSGNDKAFYTLFGKDNSIIDKTDIINSNLYSALKGGK